MLTLFRIIYATYNKTNEMSNLTSKDLYGSMTALVTPMFSDGSIDYAQWRTLIHWQVKAQMKSIIVAGTTGESALLNQYEFIQLLQIAVECCEGTQTSVIAQTGHIKTQDVIESNELAYEIGAQAVLVVTPYYIRTTQEGLLQHFTEIANVSKLPIILYNVPSRTQNDMLPKTTARLAKHEMIVGIKEASSDENRISELVALSIKDFSILSGNDDTFLSAMQQGASGVISVASNVRPFAIYQICTFMALGDFISAKKLNSSLENLYTMLSCKPNPIPVKYFLNKAGVIENGIRLPLNWLDKIADSQSEINKINDELNFK